MQTVIKENIERIINHLLSTINDEIYIEELGLYSKKELKDFAISSFNGYDNNEQSDTNLKRLYFKDAIIKIVPELNNITVDEIERVTECINNISIDNWSKIKKEFKTQLKKNNSKSIRSIPHEKLNTNRNINIEEDKITEEDINKKKEYKTRHSSKKIKGNADDDNAYDNCEGAVDENKEGNAGDNGEVYGEDNGKDNYEDNGQDDGKDNYEDNGEDDGKDNYEDNGEDIDNIEKLLSNIEEIIINYDNVEIFCDVYKKYFFIYSNNNEENNQIIINSINSLLIENNIQFNSGYTQNYIVGEISYLHIYAYKLIL